MAGRRDRLFQRHRLDLATVKIGVGENTADGDDFLAGRAAEGQDLQLAIRRHAELRLRGTQDIGSPEEMGMDVILRAPHGVL